MAVWLLVVAGGAGSGWADSELLGRCRALIAGNAGMEAVDACRRAHRVEESQETASELFRALYRVFHHAFETEELRLSLRTAFDAYEVALDAGEEELQKKALEGLHSALFAVGDLGRAAAATEARRELGLTPVGTARALLSEGSLHLQEESFALGLSRILSALEIAPEPTPATSGGERLDDSFFRAAYLNLAVASVHLGRPDEADRYIDRAVEYRESGESPAVAYYRARVAFERKEFVAARRQLEALLDKAAAADESKEWKRVLSTLYGRVLIGLGDKRGAEQALKTAVEWVDELRRDVGSGSLRYWALVRRREPAELLFKLYVDEGRTLEALEVANRLSNRAFVEAFARPRGSGRAVLKAEPALEELDRSEQLRADLSRLEESPVVAQRSAREVVEASFARPVVGFVRARGLLYRIVVAAGALRITAIDEPLEVVERLAGDFYADPDDEALAVRLAELLLPPDVLPVGRPLTIVPDPALERLPMAALLYADGRRLIEMGPILLAPTLGALPDRAESRDGSEPLVVGDPTGDLPDSRSEAYWVAEFLGTRPYYGEEAQGGLLARFADAPVMHLATHVGESLGGPWIRFHDGDLQGRELLAAGLRPRLVFLAGCASASSSRSHLWGSLGAQFLAGGAEAVVGALWAIEDAPTRRFVERFYREGGADSPVWALARSQVELLKSGSPPSEWAPFVVLTANPPIFAGTAPTGTLGGAAEATATAPGPADDR